ncbi:trace amine-associated receptor 1 [Nephila pilipes]|uniref:Trace amine-associated receptor 1 n=1 Tax=Nephila pilipes TaxID=299642 RepID=A0A8X6U6I0_NEPPI|nr:trace amine-associated receptor 1 [Nephila pilipes]
MDNSKNTTFDVISNLLNETLVYDSEMDLQYHRNFISNLSGCLATVFIALISITGNISVIVASLWDETLKVQTGNILIMYLSAIDIVTSVFVMFPSAIAVACDYWPLGGHFCRAHTILNYLCSCSSSFIIAFISFDRAIAVTYPLKYHTLITTKVMLSICCLIFALSFVPALLSCLPDWFSYNYSLGVCSVSYSTINEKIFLYGVIGGATTCFYFPACLVTICNAVILIKAKKSGKSIHLLFVKRHLINPVSDPHMRKTIKTEGTDVISRTWGCGGVPSSLGREKADETSVILGENNPRL